MTSRKLFVLKLKPGHAEEVAALFAEHDRGDMPAEVGLTRRTLFRFHDLYFHLAEGPEDLLERLGKARDRPDFRSIDTELDAHLERYDPATWRDLKDSMATPFYTWSADPGTPA